MPLQLGSSPGHAVNYNCRSVYIRALSPLNLDDYLKYNRVTVCTVQLAVGNGLALQEYAKPVH